MEGDQRPGIHHVVQGGDGLEDVDHDEVDEVLDEEGGGLQDDFGEVLDEEDGGLQDDFGEVHDEVQVGCH